MVLFNNKRKLPGNNQNPERELLQEIYGALDFKWIFFVNLDNLGYKDSTDNLNQPQPHTGLLSIKSLKEKRFEEVSLKFRQMPVRNKQEKWNLSAPKMNFSINNSFSKCEQILKFLRMRSNSLNKEILNGKLDFSNSVYLTRIFPFTESKTE